MARLPDTLVFIWRRWGGLLEDECYNARTDPECWMLFGVAFVVLIFRTHEPTIPPFEQLKVEEGAIQFLYRSHYMTRGTYIVINGHEYGCGMLWFGPSECFIDKQQQRALAGKPAKVWLYQQKSHLWYSYPVAAQIEVEVEGQIIKSGLYLKTYMSTVDFEWAGYRFSFVSSLVGMLFLLLVLVGKYLWGYWKLYRQFKLTHKGEAHVE